MEKNEPKEESQANISEGKIISQNEKTSREIVSNKQLKDLQNGKEKLKKQDNNLLVFSLIGIFVFLCLSFIISLIRPKYSTDIYTINKKTIPSSILNVTPKSAVSTTNLKRHYDYLLVGAGLFNAVLANKFIEQGKSVLVIERRNHIGGNIYTEKIENIDVHVYGAHIFHTVSKEIWQFVNKFADFKEFINTVIAYHKGKLYNLPFNMNTFYQLYGTSTPEEAMARIKEESEKEGIKNPKNLEEQAISMVGRTMYERLIKEYTEKQWGRKCTDLPPDIIKRLPLRMVFNNNYFNDRYQGIPVEGYTSFIENLYKGVDIVYNEDYLKNKEKWDSLADKVFFSGCIDEYYDYKFGVLEYRKVEFKTKILEIENFQGSAVRNYPDKDFPFTRIIEHKHFNNLGNTKKTIVSEEYSTEWKKGDTPFYPVNNERNMNLLKKYQEIEKGEGKVKFVGRLGMYKYFDMDDTIEEAFKLLKNMKI